MKKPTAKKPIKYTDEPMVMGEIMADFLPPPHLLVPKEDTIKVTLSLSRHSLDFFKQEAKKHKIPYQRMIRALIDRYAAGQKIR